MTAAAVSHQIRLLERALKTPLFERRPRGLRLTPAAQLLLSVCDRAFAEIGDVIDKIRPDAEPDTIRLASLPHFSGQVMFPLRRQFMDKNPRYNLEISHTLTAPDFEGGNMDFAVLYGKGDWPELTSELLFLSPVGPTCSPNLLPSGGLAMPADVARYPILLDHSCFQQIWVDWFELAGALGWEHLTYVPCNDIHALLGAADQGFGMIMEPEFMIGDRLAEGRLTYPVPIRLMNYGYYLVYPKHALQKTACRVFREWLTAWAESFRVRGGTKGLAAGAAG